MSIKHTAMLTTLDISVFSLGFNSGLGVKINLVFTAKYVVPVNCLIHSLEIQPFC